MATVTYPFRCKDLKSALNLVSSSKGRYALGDSSFWHGGIHLVLSDNSQAILAPSDGEIIAHRTMKKRTKGKSSVAIDSHGEKVSNGEDEDIDSSYSFVLTRHTFLTEKKNELSYYLLHMHLLCYENYTDTHKADPAPYLNGHVQHFIKTTEDDGGTLPGKGLNLRSTPTGKSNNVLTVVEKGTEFIFNSPGAYNHSKPGGYHSITIAGTKSFYIDNAYVFTGRGNDERLNLIPAKEYYDQYGILYLAEISTPSKNHMGVPLYVEGIYIGDLLERQTVYFFEKPDQQREYQIILDNIQEVIAPDAEGKSSILSIAEAMIDGGAYSNPGKDDIITLETALREACINIDTDFLYAIITIRNNTEDAGNAGKVILKEDHFSSFYVNSFHDNQCGIPAYKQNSSEHLINIPYSTRINTPQPITIEQLISTTELPIDPISIQQPETGYIWCGKNDIKRVTNEVTGTFDAIKVLNPPIKISRGQVIGFPGDQESQNIIHMELWLKDISFFDNPENEVKYEIKTSLPAGVPAKLEKIETKLPEATTISFDHEQSKSSKISFISKPRKGALRKVKYKKNIYYIYAKDLVTQNYNNSKQGYFWTESEWQSTTGGTEGATIDVPMYRSDPDIAVPVSSYSDTQTPSAIVIDPTPAIIEIEGIKYYPIEFSSADVAEQKKIYLIESSELDQYRINYYDWKRFFIKKTIADLDIQNSGFFESKESIETNAINEYNELVLNKSMEPAPDYQQDHPLSHLFIQSGSEWSKNFRNSSGWSDAVVQHMWDNENISSLEEAMGISKTVLKKVVTSTVEEYANQISFYDGVKQSIEDLPSSDAIWHAHPLRFLQHIDLLKPGRAPWMEIALQQAKRANGCHEGTEPLLSMGTDYLKSAGNSHSPDNDKSGQWCAAFLSWCIEKAEFKTPDNIWKRASSQQFRLLDGSVYKKIEEPIFGAIAVYTNIGNSSRGHVGFLYGKTKKGKLILLGGNQDDTIRCTQYNSLKTRSKKFNGFYIPIDYEVSQNDYLSIEEISYTSDKEANKKIGISVYKVGTDGTE